MEVREARCHFLAAVLAADGMMHDDERTMLEADMLTRELDDEEKDRVRAFNGLEAAAERLKAEPESLRQEVMDQLVEAALVDGKLTPLETAAVKRLGALLGL
jgi:uncharacterized tellurite resistance protein B-like protein